MLIRLFKLNQKIVNALAIVLLLLLWIPSFLMDSEAPNLFITGLRWLDNLFLIVLIGCQAIYLNFIVSEYKLVKENSHLTSLIYIVLNSCFLWLLELNLVLFANIFLLMAFHQLLRIYNAKDDYSISFNAGLLIGLAGMIYAPLFVYFILVWIVLIYAGTPSWRNFIISLLGLCVPLIYFVAYHLIWDDLLTIDVGSYFIRLFDVGWQNFNLYNQLFLVVLLIVCCFAFLNLFTTIGRSVVKTSRMLVMVLLMVVLGVATMFLNQYDFSASLLVLSIPLAVIIANFFQNMKKMWLAEFLFSCMLLSIILGYFS